MFLYWIYILLIPYRSVISDALGGSPIEDILETQVDSRLPSSFPRYETLVVRTPGFFSYHIDNLNSSQEVKVGNWEVFAMQYWYETRPQGMICPQIPSGIAAQCDWALMIPCLFGNVNIPPKSIFVHTLMLPHFIESTLRLMPNKSWEFVVISGGVDRTVPRSILDQRYRHQLRGFSGNEDGGDYFKMILESKQVVHWFAENRDLIHSKFSSFPTGLSWEGNPDDRSDYPDPKTIIPIDQRPLKVLNADRIRDGRGQWEDRATVFHWCQDNVFCEQLPNGGLTGEKTISHEDYLKLIASVPFVACVHGGGIDPSPKAWESILVGSIPIIQNSSYIHDAYSHLPVAFVDDYSVLFTFNRTEAMLRKWLEELTPYYQEGSFLRRETLEKLKTSYWLNKALNKLHVNDHISFLRRHKHETKNSTVF